MKTKTCTFAGHAQFIPHSIFNALVMAIENFMRSTDNPVFLVGGIGEFDEMSAGAVRTVKRKYPQKNIRLCLVCAYMKNSLNREKEYLESLYDEIIICDKSENAHYKAAIKIRNRYMVDCASLLICYVHNDFGGAYETLKYATKQKEIIITNLAENTMM